VPKKPLYSLSLFIFLVLIIAVPMPAHAYGDPSGGMLFQILTPILAALWGAWLVFAHKIHRWFHKVTGKDAGTTAESHEAEHADAAPALSQRVERAGVQE
jgi:Ca2+/H+ antiporter